MKSPAVLLPLLLGLFHPCFSQIPDTTLNNLVHPPGYLTAEWGSLHWQKIGNGKKIVLFLPGWGFDGASFRAYFEENFSDCSVYLLTLPGYGGTRAYPMPPNGTSYGEGVWMKAVGQGILHLLETEKLKRPALVAHFSVASHIALQLALEHPEKLGKIALIGAPALMHMPPPNDTIGYASRVQGVNLYLAPRWFKTVTIDTWRKGNFIPATYSLDSLTAARRFEEANAAPLPVQIGYLCEYWAADYASYERVRTPVLALLPSFTPDLLAEPMNFYLKWYSDAWASIAAKNPHIRTLTVEGTAVNIMDDQPEQLSHLLREFLWK